MKVFAIVGLLLLVGCGPVMKPVTRVVSPSGGLVIAAIPNESKTEPTKDGCIRLILEDRSGKVLAAIQTEVSDHQKWAVGWMDKEDIIVLQSSDVGTRAYIVHSNEFRPVSISPEIETRARQLKSEKYGK